MRRGPPPVPRQAFHQLLGAATPEVLCGRAGGAFLPTLGEPEEAQRRPGGEG